MVPRSLHFATAPFEAQGKEGAVAPVGMTKQEKANPKDERRSCRAFDRKSPPFAQFAKDGAPSSACARIAVAREAAGCIFNATKDGKIKISDWI